MGGQNTIDLGLGLAEGVAGEVVQGVEQLEHFRLILLAQRKLHHVVVAEAQLARHLIAKRDQFLQVGRHQRAHFLAGLPHGLALGRAWRGLQQTAHLVVGEFLAVHPRAIRAEGILDLVR